MKKRESVRGRGSERKRKKIKRARERKGETDCKLSSLQCANLIVTLLHTDKWCHLAINKILKGLRSMDLFPRDKQSNSARGKCND